MVIYHHKKHATLQRILEIKCHMPITHLFGDLKKAAIATFLTELLHKVLYEEEQNVRLFDFVLQSISRLDQLTEGHELFYLDFMLQLCTYLGFGCTQATEINTQLIRSGFTSLLNTQEINILDSLLNHAAPPVAKPSKQSMRNMLANIVRYFQLHVDTLDTLKSLPVLQEISG
jgi:DNA repair protein RecO (recombination protein O)